ncbi:Ig-like domain-containing protein [Anaerolinea sp.]|uniref:Ig-like domain-containing protein n=1 Tax=Anaerolinea sp. TaxID=1872519 RepID=UPI002ACE0D9B|nr:Ig-like domain-containing protein [Anaerolinea sp.]
MVSSSLRPKSPFFVLISVILLVSMACSLPAWLPGQTQPTPTEASPTQPPAPIQSDKPRLQEDLPPTIVETDPFIGSEIAPNSSLTFYFNQPMERLSVEGAFRGSPPLAGRFEWLDDATVRFIPDQPWAPGTEIEITLETSARAANGKALQETISLRYRVATALKVAERIPAPNSEDIRPDSAIVVTFNRPIVPLGADPAGLPAAFTLSPIAEGRGEWLNTSTYIFYPEPALQGGQTYTVQINPDLQSIEGLPLELNNLQPAEWQFTTALPRVISITYPRNPDTEQLELQGEITLTFNQPMDTASVAENLRLLDPQSNPVSGKVEWNEEKTVFTFKPDQWLSRNAVYTLTLASETRSRGGQPLGSPYTLSMLTLQDFALSTTRPAPGDLMNINYGYGYGTLTFTSPLDPEQDLKKLIRFDPPVTSLDIHYESKYSIGYFGIFSPSTTYTIFVDSNLRDRYGQVLGTPLALKMTTNKLPPSLILEAPADYSQIVFLPAGNPVTPARVTGLSSVRFSFTELSVDEFMTSMVLGEAPSYKQRRSFTRTFDVAPNQSQRVNLNVSPDGNPLPPGIYWLFSAAPGADQSASSNYYLISSRIHLTLKVSPDQAHLWAVSLPDESPVAGLRISIGQASQNEWTNLGECTTDAQGICTVDLPYFEEPPSYLFATSGSPGSADFSIATTEMRAAVPPWEAGISQAYYARREFVYLYTDRPIYRPGQTVYFKGIFRYQNDYRYTLPEPGEVEVQLLSPYDGLGTRSPASTMRLTLSPNGTLSGEFNLPDDALEGWYSIEIPEWKASKSFQVAYYRKPLFELTLSPQSPEILLGEDFLTTLSATYYFGAPVSDLEFRWTLKAISEMSYLPGGYHAGSYDAGWLRMYKGVMYPFTYIADGSGTTGKNGTAQIRVTPEQFAQLNPTQRHRLILEVYMSDESQLRLSAQTEVVLHPERFEIGAKPEAWSVRAGEPAGFSILTVDWKGNPTGNLDLSAVFSRVEWQAVESNAPYGHPEYERILTPVARTDLRTDEKGRARVEFTPSEAGTYMLTLQGGRALTEVMIWVSGAGAPLSSPSPDRGIPIDKDAREYTPGDNAVLSIPNPFNEDTLALITVERGRVLRSYVVRLESGIATFRLPIEERDAPKVFASVILLGRTSDGQPDYRAGYVEIPVKPNALLLNVEIGLPPSPVAPGQEVTLEVKLSDSEGIPVQGEFSLAMVDKAVLALSPEKEPTIEEMFYGEVNLLVRTHLPLAHFIPHQIEVSMGRGGGGGGGGEMVVSPETRSRFEDTAVWFATVETDAQGRASLPVRLPDNLTTWVVDVRGVTGDSRVGSSTAELIVSRPVLVMPVIPRFLVVGDHLQIGALVANNTPQARTAQVSLNAAGLTLDDPAQATQTVELPANGRTRVDWWVRVEDVTSIDPIFRVVTDEYSDATRSELAPIPVLRFTAYQTYASAGVLAQGGERLEVVSLPRTFQPTGGELRIELSPSLAGSVLSGLEAFKAYPTDWNETVVSRLMANLATYRALKDFNLPTPDLQNRLEKAIRADLRSLIQSEGYNGYWGWMPNVQEGDPRLTAYALMALHFASQQDYPIDEALIERVRNWLAQKSAKIGITEETYTFALENAAFQGYVLSLWGNDPIGMTSLYWLRNRLSPAGQTFLALAMENLNPGDENAKTLIQELLAGAQRSATGAFWQSMEASSFIGQTPISNTAVVVYGLSRFEPSSALIPDAVRYLVMNRQPAGGWYSSYDTAWTILALTEALRSTGDLRANFAYSAELNGSVVASGSASTPADALNPVTATIPLSDLRADSPNALRIRREPGDGRLYYRTYLAVGRDAAEAPPVSRGLFVQREYFDSTQPCTEQVCQPVKEITHGLSTELLVRLTVTVPQDLYNVVVEDTFPAGTEALNPRLKTSQVTPNPESPIYDLQSPLREGWGWWWFNQPRISDQTIRWFASYLPAGTYTLIYRLIPTFGGEFQVIPARAYSVYFPEIEGRSSGSLLVIR